MKQLVFSLLIFTATFLNLSAQRELSSPAQIMLTIPDNPATSAAVSWRTPFEDTVSVGQIALADASPAFAPASVSVAGACAPWENGSIRYMGHKVVFNGLIPETKYAYRVGNGEQWSEWFQFKTASATSKPFSILYLGDVQNDILSLGSRALRQAYSHFPDARFMLFAGDLVSRSFEKEWGEFFDAGGWIFGMMPSLPTPGNHEYYPVDEGRERPFSRQWKQIFTLPGNGPSSKFKERVYFMDYQGVRFISLDSPALGYNDQDETLIIQWLENTLASNPCRWSVVFTHYPIYSCSQGRDSEKYRDMVRPILEKYGVDLVLQGHDHTYCRGQNLEKAGTDVKNHPMYVVSVAGPKMYGLNSSLWADRVASETQLYQHITFSGTEIVFQAFTVAGDLYDAFSLVKGKNGVNKVIIDPVVKKVSERLSIPESRKNSYTLEELEKLNNRAKNN